MRSPFLWRIADGPLPMVIEAIWSRGTIMPVPPTEIGRRSMLSVLTRSSGCRRTATSRVSLVGSTQSPTSMPAKATRSDWAASPTEMPIMFARPRSSTICSSFFGSCSDRVTSTAPGTSRSLTMKALVSSISLRESGPLNSICTGLPLPLRSSMTVYSAPTRRLIFSRSSTATSEALRSRWRRLPISTYTRPPLRLTLLLVSSVSGRVRASSAAASTLRRAYSTLDEAGTRTSTMMVPESIFGRKLEPPKLLCRAMAPTKLARAMKPIQRRWCSAQAITRP